MANKWWKRQTQTPAVTGEPTPVDSVVVEPAPAPAPQSAPEERPHAVSLPTWPWRGHN